MTELLSALIVWLSINFALPGSNELPDIAFLSPERMALARQERVSAAGSAPAVNSYYDDVSRTIHLPDDWTARSPAHLSLLVHELVHHLQNVGEETHACAAARERPAYRAQARWLELLGTSIEAEFEIDAMTLLVRTSCTH